MQKDVILTPEGLEKLKQEIEHLSTTKRREVAERIKEAREFGDISENSEYDDAKNEQAMLESRIMTLEDKLRSASVIDASELSPDVVRVGSQVHVKDEKGKALTYTIVGSTEADRRPTGSRTSRPVGKALVGHKEGDSVKVTLPTASRASSPSPRSKSHSGGEREGVPDEARLATRRRKLEALREAGVEPFPHAYPGVTPIASEGPA